MKTFLLKKEGDMQTFFTPSMRKVYSNNEFKVYKSYFDGDTEYLVIRLSDNLVAFVEELQGVQEVDFKYKVWIKF